MRTIRYDIDDAHDGMTVERFLKGKDYSRAVFTHLKQNDGLHLNGVHIRTVDRIASGDILTVMFRDKSEAAPNSDLHADIVYDDEDIVVFDKLADMPVHTSIWHGRDTLANLFSALYPDSYYHSVGRLDKDTSGLIAIAKNKLVSSLLMTCEKYRPNKVYYAVTDSSITEEYGEEGEIIAPIARDKENVIKRTVREDGEYARTFFRTVMRNDRYCLHEITLYTGRTHQIRVHFSYIGHPLIGDKLYGGDTSVLNRQALHCGKLSLKNPVTGAEIDLASELPPDIMTLFDKTNG